MLSTKLTTVHITVDCVALDYVVLKIRINGLAGRYLKKKDHIHNREAATPISYNILC